MPAAHPAFDRLDHRPWPPPGRPWRWRQTWNDLLFAHWPVEARLLRPLVPGGLSIDEFGGMSWIGLVPFHMTGVSMRGVPDLPWVSAFPEMNLRLYVTAGNMPGVWFLSLDASNWAAVLAARLMVGLPYFWASMSTSWVADRIRYRSARRVSGGRVAIRGEYWPVGPVREPVPGTLEHFLVERYCLYTQRGAGLWRLQIHHPPWPVQAAAGELQVTGLAERHGIVLPRDAPLLHFARRLSVVGWGLERVDGSGTTG